MYVNFILTENFVSKEYLEPKDVQNNVRKWPNMCSIKLQNVEKIKSEAQAVCFVFVHIESFDQGKIA